MNKKTSKKIPAKPRKITEKIPAKKQIPSTSIPKIPPKKKK